MPTAKLQSALAKSLMSLKQRDQVIHTLKGQLRAQANASPLPTSTPPRSVALEAANIEAQRLVEEAQLRKKTALARAAKLQGEVKQLVEASKQRGEAHAAQVQQLQKELTQAKRIASECKEAKVQCPGLARAQGCQRAVQRSCNL
jgi:hypothetical protein